MNPRRQRTVATAVLAVALIGTGGAVASGALSTGAEGGRADSPSASASSTTSTVAEPPLERSEPVRVHVPRMRLRAPVVSLDAGDDQVMQLPPLRKAGWDSTSVTPGEQGVAVLAGFIRHRDRPGVLEHLGRLRRGDAVVVRREDSSVARFRVDRITSYELGSFPADQVYASSGVPELRLISTGGSLPGQPAGNVVVYATAVTASP